jgi:hypothetical protein
MIKRFLLATSFGLAAAMALLAFAFADAKNAPRPPVPPPSPPVVAPSVPVANTIQLVWLVYMSGIRLGVVGLKTTFEPGTYASVSSLKTGGLINVFYEARINANAAGSVAGAALRPHSYSADADTRKKQKTALAYSAAGISLFADPPYNTERFPVSDEQKRDTLDPVSAMSFAISGLSVTQERPCGDTLHVFDGARRYDVEFKFIANETLNSGSDGYSGPAVKCEVIYKQIAGFKPSVKQGDKTYPIYVWGAVFQTQAAGTLRRFVVPVKIMTETSFGSAVAMAHKIMVDGEKRSD